MAESIVYSIWIFSSSSNLFSISSYINKTVGTEGLSSINWDFLIWARTSSIWFDGVSLAGTSSSSWSAWASWCSSLALHISKCLINYLFVTFPRQALHLRYGPPLCESRCFFWFAIWLKVWSQPSTGHSKGFSPVCVLRWSNKPYGFLKNFPQCEWSQEYIVVHLWMFKNGFLRNLN